MFGRLATTMSGIKVEVQDDLIEISDEESADEWLPDKDVPKSKSAKRTPKSKVAKPAIKKGVKRKAEDDGRNKPTKKSLKVKKEEFGTEKSENDDFFDQFSSWSIPVVVAEQLQVPVPIINSVIRLLDDDYTIPFIARYRRENTDNMDAQKLHEVQSTYNTLKSVKKSIASVSKSIQKLGKMSPVLQSALNNSICLEEVEHLYAPFKPGSKLSLAEKARALGLDPPALRFLDGQHVDLTRLVNPSVKGLQSLNDVETGIRNIIADIISKDKPVMDFVRGMCFNSSVVQIKSTVHKEKTKEIKESTQSLPTSKQGLHQKTDHKEKFEMYYNFSININHAKPHQILALNRGESLKVLSVKINIPNSIQHQYVEFSYRRYNVPPKNSCANDDRSSMMSICMEYAYNRLIEPQMCRQIRTKMTKYAETESVNVFATNLKQLLLTPPVKGKVIMGIDPGFKHGCKLAVISPIGDVLATDIMYLPNNISHLSHDPNARKLREMLLATRCDTIGVGNGTACRETEEFVSQVLSAGGFDDLNVVYCIVNESGASIYSVTPEATTEFPQMDPNLRSAVSIARRLQDPLAEYIKIDPKHLGIGMYQHDVSATMLKTSLDGVVVDCVSFVGVDINTASEQILKKIAGLGAVKARKITEWRTENGPFVNRDQLKLVKGLGAKSFEQCAGFVRVVQQGTSVIPVPAATTTKLKGKRTKLTAKIDSHPNPLDMTNIHPESYHLAACFISDACGCASEIGEPNFIMKVRKYVETTSMEQLAVKYGCGKPTIKLVTEGLLQPLGYDLRSEFEKPLFRSKLKDLTTLKAKMVLTGQIRNIVNFGAFVDIGVGTDGLLHTSRMHPVVLRGRCLQLGDKIEVQVLDVDIRRKRISLDLRRVL